MPEYPTLIDGYILTRVAADLLGVSHKSGRIRQLIAAGMLTARKRDGDRRVFEVRLDDVLALASRERKAGRPVVKPPS